MKLYSNMAAIRLRAIPPSVIKYILKVQNEMKRKRKIGQYSQELTVIQIIREHEEMNSKKPS